VFENAQLPAAGTPKLAVFTAKASALNPVTVLQLIIFQLLEVAELQFVGVPLI
jgi:hypothetical protein